MMAFVYTLLFVSWFCSILGSAQTIITTTQFLTDSEFLVSNNTLFRMGFFSPANLSSRYVGIWYNNEEFDISDVIWVANRDNPLNDSSGVLKISEDGNLQLLNARSKIFWTSNVHFEANGSSVAQLQDTGNLVLILTSSGTMVWQSFDHPTNSLLSQMELTADVKMHEKKQLISWKSPSDPSSGRFILGIYPRKLLEAFVWDGDRPYWRSGPWNGNVFIGLPYMYSVLLDGFSLVTNNKGALSLKFSLANPSILTHFVLGSDGIVTQKDWNDRNLNWDIIWTSLESECDIYGKCGPFGSCYPKRSPICVCLKGFEPKNREEWSKGNWTGGCVRKKPLWCGSGVGRTDGFLRLRNMKPPDDAGWLSSRNQKDCGRKCREDCQCLAYAYYPGTGCMIWNRSLIDLQQFPVNGVDLFIRLDQSELGLSGKWEIILLVLIIIVTTVSAVMCYIRRSVGQLKGRSRVMSYNTSFSDMLNPSASLVEFQDLPLFKFEELVIATNKFQESNELGRGGFGPVYKGKLEDGREIAVKRLSRTSGQGPQEFMNEVLLISKLQHRNLVRLLGCCIKGEEKMLVYEYMSNRSLDAFLFDPVHREILDWEKRFSIIDGICRGLLYLHRDSRLRVIHRDLKASNILLDDDLNPKISDFGMARIFGCNQDQADTKRVVGTYGYMSPEYAMEGRFSEKSDVSALG